MKAMPAPARKPTVFPSVLSCLALFLLWGAAGRALAAADTWTGGGGTDNWTDTGNWGGLAPLTNDQLFFDGSTRLTPNNDFSAGTIFNSITFNGGASAFTLGGNSLTLTNGSDNGDGTASGGGLTNSSPNTQIVNLPLRLSAGKHVAEADGGGQLTLSGAITRNTGAVVVFSPVAGTINLTGSGLANINGILGGWATLGNDWAALDGSVNVVAYSGYTDISGGAVVNNPASNLRYGGDTANITAATGTTVNSILAQIGAARSLVITGIMKVGSKGGIYRNNIASATFTVSGGTLTASGGGEITLLAQPGTTGGGLTISSIITNDGPANVVSVNVHGYISANAANTYSGGTYISQGRDSGNNAASFGTGPVFVYPSGQAFFGGNVTWTNNFFISGIGSTELSPTSGGQNLGAIRFSGGASILSGTITLVGDARISGGSAGANVIRGKITGPGRLELTSSTGNNGSITLTNASGNNDWSGGLLITVGAASRQVYLKLGGNEVIPDGAGKGNLTINGTSDIARFDLNGFSETINGLIAASSANNQVANFGAAASTLTLGGNNATATFGGNINDANANTNLSVVKIGAGTQTFTGANNYRGGTTVSGGSLIFGLGATLPNISRITVNSNATLDVSAVPSASLAAFLQSLTVSNGTFNLAVSPSAPTFTATNLTVNGANNLITIAAIGPISGYPAQFPILKGISVTGTLNFAQNGPFPTSPGAPYAGYVSNNIANNSVDLVLTSGPVLVKWAGYSSGAPNSAWDTTTSNWRLANGAPTTYADGEFALFDDSASNSIVALNQTVAPAAITATNSVLNYTIAGSQLITGAGGLLKQGSATLTLDNTGVNDFSGGVVISAGTLQIGNNDSAGNLPATGSIINNGALVFARVGAVSVPNVISGSGTLTQNGVGATLNLSGANTFTGSVTVVQGTLQIGNNSALGTTNGITTIASGATLDFLANANNIGQEPVVVSGSGVGTLGAIINSSGNPTFANPSIARLSLAGDTVVGGTGRWDLRASTTSNPNLASLSTGGIARKLTKVGPNQVSIVGVTVDPALGDIDIQAGLLSMEVATTGLGNTASNLIVEAGAELQLFAITNLLNKVITLNGDGVTTNLNSASGANTVVGPITLNGNVLVNVAGTSLTLNGPLAGTGSLTKSGASPLTINGNGSLLTGSVTIDAGSLTLNGILGGALTNSFINTTLTGTGTNLGPADIWGPVFPGASNVVGTLTFGGLLLESGASVSFDLSGNAAAVGGGTNDLIVVNGDLTVNGNTITINPLDLLQTGAPGYRLFNYTNNLIWNSDLYVPGVGGYTFAVDTNTLHQVNLVVSGGPPIWNGGSATDSNWTDPANWNGITIGSGSLLYFAGNNRLNNTNDTPADTTYGDITFTLNAAPFVLNGNSLTLGGNIVNNSANPQTVDLNMSFGVNRTFSGQANPLIIGGALTNTANTTLTLSGTGTLTNLLYTTDPNSMTNIISVSSNANWTLMDNPSSTAITNPVQLDILAGTFNFGQGASAPNLNSIANNNISRLGGISGVPATFNMVNGTLTIAARLNTGVAANAVSTLNQTGGTLNLLSLLQVSDSSTAASTTVNVSGGTLIVGTPANRNTLFLASRGTGVLNVASSGLIQCGILDVSRNAGGNTLGSVGVVNLNGGTLIVDRVGTATGSSQSGGTPTASFNFNGGTLKAGASSATFFQGNAGSPALPIISTVKSGGAIIDSDTRAITILEPLQHDPALGATQDGGLRKLGSGTLTLTGASTYTGNTVVSNGTLAVNGSLGITAVTVATNGTLSGVGSFGSNVTVNTGGAISPGGFGAIGTLTVASNVTLNGRAIMELNKSSATNDVIKAANITYGGTLTATNLAGTLAAGDSFKLFSATTYSGSFTLSPAQPALGLKWDTSALAGAGATGGILKIVGLPTPGITSTVLSGSNLVISGTNGTAGFSYRVLTSSDLTIPINLWPILGTNVFDGSGNFQFTVGTTNQQQFFRLQAL